MINSTANYKAAIIGNVRRMYVQATVNIVDPDITFGAPSGSPQSAYSQGGQLHDYDFDAADKYATLELNRWQLDGTYEPAPAVIISQVGYVTAAISGADGVFAVPQIITQSFANVGSNTYSAERIFTSCVKASLFLGRNHNYVSLCFIRKRKCTSVENIKYDMVFVKEEYYEIQSRKL